MADKQRMSAARSRLWVRPQVATGLVVTLGLLLVVGGCVSAESSSGRAAPTATQSSPAAVAPLPPSAVPAPTGPGEPVVSPPPGGGTLPTTPASLPAPTAVTVLPATAPLVVTTADDGTTLHLAVGQQFLLRLGSGVDWTVSVGAGQVLERVTGVALPAGDQGVYEARTSGTTVLSAVGIPHCTAGVCPLFRLGFSVTITVS